MQRKKTSYGQGVYLGTGVAAGGQQGRMGVFHNGMGAAQGGSTPGASQRRKKKNPLAKVPKDSFAKKPFKPKPSNRPNPTKGPPSREVRQGPTTPAPGPTVATPPPLPNFDAYRDADYWDALNEAQGAFEDSYNPLTAEIAGLESRGVSGKTLYDLMYEKAGSEFRRSNMLQRDQASKQGLLRSGWQNREAAALGEDYVAQADNLDKTYGKTKLSQLEQARLGLRQKLDSQKGLLAKAASARGREDFLARMAAQYAPMNLTPPSWGEQ